MSTTGFLLESSTDRLVIDRASGRLVSFLANLAHFCRIIAAYPQRQPPAVLLPLQHQLSSPRRACGGSHRRRI